MATVKRRYPNYKLQGSFSGLSGFKKDANVKENRENIKKVLTSIPAYALHYPRRRNFPRRRIHVSGMFKQWAMDLKDIQSESRYNNKKKFLLMVIDVFSKRGYMEALANKAMGTVKQGLERIYKRSGGVAPLIHIDKGTEFRNKVLTRYLSSMGVKLFSTESEIKSSVVERFIRSVFGKIQRYLTHNKTRKFVDKLKYFENLYNNSYHRSIKMTPNQVTRENQDQVYKNLYGNQWVDYKPPRFKIGDFVLVSKRKLVFEKGYKQNYLNEKFKIVGIRESIPRVYMLEDKDERPVREKFYEQQMLKV